MLGYYMYSNITNIIRDCQGPDENFFVPGLTPACGQPMLVLSVGWVGLHACREKAL